MNSTERKLTSEEQFEKDVYWDWLQQEVSDLKLDVNTVFSSGELKKHLRKIHLDLTMETTNALHEYFNKDMVKFQEMYGRVFFVNWYAIASTHCVPAHLRLTLVFRLAQECSLECNEETENVARRICEELRLGIVMLSLTMLTSDR